VALAIFHLMVPRLEPVEIELVEPKKAIGA